MRYTVLYCCVLCLLGMLTDVLHAQEELELVTKQSMSVAITAEAVALGRMTGDETIDAVAVGKISTTARYSLFSGTGDGSFSDAPSNGALYNSPSDLVIGDFNNDGKLDFVALNGGCG